MGSKRGDCAIPQQDRKYFYLGGQTCNTTAAQAQDHEDKRFA